MERPVRKLSRIGSRNGLFAKICEWQFIQVLVGGMPANAESSKGVAVAAVDAVAGDVALVTELNRLLACHLDLGHPGRAVDFGKESEEAGNEEDGAEDADLRNGVGAAVEDLRHREVRGPILFCEIFHVRSNSPARP